LVSATALQSLEIASDTILSGKAKLMIAGGFDDSEEGSFEFANMKATSNAETEFAMSQQRCLDLQRRLALE
jgi:fatty acid synthase subunit alpha, fungi type